jgi:hypothetical protein
MHYCHREMGHRYYLWFILRHSDYTALNGDMINETKTMSNGAAMVYFNVSPHHSPRDAE